MKKLVIYLIVTILVIIVEGFYFEYCVSRPLNQNLQWGATALAVLIFGIWIDYTVKTLKTLLKL